MPRSKRPTLKPYVRFTEELGERICQRLRDGESLFAICKGDDMPDESAVRLWAADPTNPFSAAYSKAREIGYLRLADELLDIADNTQQGAKLIHNRFGTEKVEGDMIEHRRLRVDTRKWILSKMLPKVYGDKLTQEHTGPGGEALEPSAHTYIVAVPPTMDLQEWLKTYAPKPPSPPET